MMEIRLEGVGKVFPSGVRALTDVNLVVEPGACLVFVGPSGCGKTTLLRLIAGLETPTTGTIRLDGVDVHDVPPWRRRVALVFQRPALLPAQTVRQNLAWPWLLRSAEPWRSLGRLLGRRLLRPDEEKALELVAALLHLSDILDQRAGELSGGQQQRVALGRALLREDGARLLDEPLAHVDVPLRTELRREMRLLSRQLPATMIYVTHDPAEALALGGKIAVLQDGALQQVAPAHRILEAPANRLVAELFSQQAGGLNLIDGSLTIEGSRLCFAGPWGLWSLPESWTALRSHTGPATLGIRGKDVRVVADTSLNQVRLPVVLQEFDGAGSWLVCGDERGRLTAWLENSQDVDVGQTVMVQLNLEHGFCFERGSGQALRVPTG